MELSAEWLSPSRCIKQQMVYAYIHEQYSHPVPLSICNLILLFYDSLYCWKLSAAEKKQLLSDETDEKRLIMHNFHHYHPIKYSVAAMKGRGTSCNFVDVFLMMAVPVGWKYTIHGQLWMTTEKHRANIVAKGLWEFTDEPRLHDNATNELRLPDSPVYV